MTISNKLFLKNLIIFIIVFMVVNLLETKDVWAASQIIAEVRDKAAHVIEHYKPIVYILGGFGLVCVAWGAIFGKMNWKWFANLAIGLFLVAWMGHLIDYFTKNKASSTASAKFSSTSKLVKFGDTINKKSLADGGNFSSLQIKGSGEAGEYSSLLSSNQDSIAYLESDWVKTAIERSGNSLYAARAASTLVSGSAYNMKDSKGSIVDAKKILQTGSDWEEAAQNADKKYKDLVAARAGSMLSSGSAYNVKDTKGEDYDIKAALRQGSDWKEASDKYKDDMHVAGVGSNLENGSFKGPNEDGTEHVYLAGGNAMTNFSRGFSKAAGGFGDAQTFFEFGSYDGYEFGNSDYAQYDMADLAGEMMYDTQSMMLGYEVDDYSGLNTETRRGDFVSDNFDGLNTETRRSYSGTTLGNLNTGSNLVGNSGNVGSDWADTDVAYTASNLVDGELTYTDADGEHTDSADGNTHTTLAGANDDYGYQGDVDTNMNSADGYQNVNTNMNSAEGYQNVNTNMNSARGYQNVNTNMNSAAGYKDVKTNMNSPAGYRDVKTNLNSPAGYKDEETHWGR